MSNPDYIEVYNYLDMFAPEAWKIRTSPKNVKNAYIWPPDYLNAEGIKKYQDKWDGRELYSRSKDRIKDDNRSITLYSVGLSVSISSLWTNKDLQSFISEHPTPSGFVSSHYDGISFETPSGEHKAFNRKEEIAKLLVKKIKAKEIFPVLILEDKEETKIKDEWWTREHTIFVLERGYCPNNKQELIWFRTYDNDQKKRNRRGRKKGSGTIDDSVPVHKMHNLIQYGKAKSINDAAIQVLNSLKIQGSSDSAIIRRITKKYNEIYSQES